MINRSVKILTKSIKNWRDIGTERARVGSPNKVSHVIKTKPKAAMFPRAKQCTAYRVNGKELQISFTFSFNGRSQ